jgi:hypothetical protein
VPTCSGVGTTQPLNPNIHPTTQGSQDVLSRKTRLSRKVWKRLTRTQEQLADYTENNVLHDLQDKWRTGEDPLAGHEPEPGSDQPEE